MLLELEHAVTLPAVLLVTFLSGYAERALAQDALDTKAPATLVSSAASATPSVQLTLSAEQPYLTVYRTQDGVYGVKLCSPNCARAIKPGSYSFGVRSGTEKPVWDKRVFPIDRDQTLFVEYESHRASRRAGAILVPASLVTALFVGLVTWFMAGLLHDTTEPGAIVGYGIVAVGCAGLVGGSAWLLKRRDRAVIRTPAEHAGKVTARARFDGAADAASPAR